MTQKDSLQVSLCASFVIEPLQDYMEYWCKEFELNTDVTFAPYNQVFQQLIDPQSLLSQNTGINFLFIRIEDWIRDLGDRSTGEQSQFLHTTFDNLKGAVEQARTNSLVPYCVCLVPLSLSHPFSAEIAVQVEKLTQELEMFLKTIPGFYLFDLQQVARLYEIEEMFDPIADKMGHLPFSQDMYAAIGTFLTRKIRAFKGPSYKVIAVDCDNTLWKGVCGEDGALNVIIDENYLALQQFLIGKYNEGFLIVLTTKNNEGDVWEVFEKHPGMLLKRHHIAAHRINWNPKSGNLTAIARELNVGADSFIFLDDSGFEVEQMSFSCPEVFCIQLPEEASSFNSFLNHIWQFDIFQVTEEDLQRNKMYKAEQQRKEDQVNYAMLDDFLASLQITVDLDNLQEKDLDRALQLTLRTNQFNLNGRRKTREELVVYLSDSDVLKWIIEVKDRFGNYGKVGLLIGRQENTDLVIETFLLSCRVLGRNVEEVILSKLKDYCELKGINMIKAQFRPTAKNQPFADFLHNSSWIADSENNSFNLLVRSKSILLSNVFQMSYKTISVSVEGGTELAVALGEIDWLEVTRFAISLPFRKATVLLC